MKDKEVTKLLAKIIYSGLKRCDLDTQRLVLSPSVKE